jgi:hypothetical protein
MNPLIFSVKTPGDMGTTECLKKESLVLIKILMWRVLVKSPSLDLKDLNAELVGKRWWRAEKKILFAEPWQTTKMISPEPVKTEALSTILEKDLYLTPRKEGSVIMRLWTPTRVSLLKRAHAVAMFRRLAKTSLKVVKILLTRTTIFPVRKKERLTQLSGD